MTLTAPHAALAPNSRLQTDRLRADLAGSVPEGVPVDVRHAPLPAAPLAPAAFTSPRGGAAERLPVDRQASDAQSAPASSSISSPYLPVADDGAELDDEALPHALPVVAHELAALAAQVLRARSVEAFGVGKAARAVARALAPAAAALVSADDGDNADASEAAEASDATSKVAVVVVDRTCDLAAALTHGDSFTGRAVAALAPPPQAPLARGAAAALPSAAARAAEGAAAFERAAARQDDVAAGADATSTPALLLAEELLGRRGRDGAMACRKAMMEALKAAGVPKPAASRGGGASSRSDELRALADALDGAPSPSAQRAHARVAALGRCAAALLQEGATAAWDAAASAERVVTHALAEPSTQSVEAVLEDALKAAAAAPSQPMGLGDVLALAALVVLLKQRAHKELGRSLADSLGAALAAEPGAAEQSDAPDAAAAMGARVREWLSDLARLSSAQLGRDEGAGGEVAPAPLLARLCAAALQRAEPALGSGVRLYKAPAGLGGALVSGLTGMASALRGGGGLTSALGAALAPTAGQERRIDADVVVVYVLGGVTPLELREAKDAAKQAEAQWQRAGSGAAGKPPRLIVGGSRLLTPEGLMAQLWQLS